ncbi:23S rRNA (guanosine(2251)-2'-O)-methyltransferase RlmB [Arthrobacter sp. UM1]|uniref:23S rRNA (guanosine(2251)-2'-O)-methyltransferase RlmB n=1 Tax=Arthrobacter sp. UM1 TaxID=2766776 RepID=UPI001CF6491B|nr:23S rRNA (guanosine(2251)-2'-O)-methyltransferase RlmB [Arthrobacter sp. UM1]MCB4209136.1 23S rRNA (guanosine(2251)-2'-O)-methyltransferase RlmB [Arthrobacter sp. UM1]
MAGNQRPGAQRKPSKKKGPQVGTGGHGRKALAGKGPTPKAEDRVYHKAHRAKQLAERSAAKHGGAQRGGAQRSRTRTSAETVTGRNSVVEALRAEIPAKALYVATRIEMDDRVKEALKIAGERGIPLLEASKAELDRLTEDAVHQGLALHIPPYEYADGLATVQRLTDQWNKGHLSAAPIIVALDGITDPRNLGAIIRSVSAFSGHAVIIPERRSAGMTASAWKTSAGAAVRVPVAKATNLNTLLGQAKKLGCFVLGLDGGGEVSLPGLALAQEPIVIVVGSEGKGLSRLVRENCDQIVSIPIDGEMESLNASMAVGISLYEVARQRSASA